MKSYSSEYCVRFSTHIYEFFREHLQQKRNEYRKHLEELKKSLALPKNKREIKSGERK